MGSSRTVLEDKILWPWPWSVLTLSLALRWPGLVLGLEVARPCPWPWGAPALSLALRWPGLVLGLEVPRPCPWPWGGPALALRMLSLNTSLQASWIGHTRLTHSYLLLGDDQPECGSCQCPFTVKHILIECIDLNDVRNKTLLSLQWKICLKMLHHRTSLILSRKPIFISNFNVCVLMFVTCFFYSS